MALTPFQRDQPLTFSFDERHRADRLDHSGLDDQRPRRPPLFRRRGPERESQIATRPCPSDPSSNEGAASAKLEPDIGQGRAGGPQLRELVVEGHGRRLPDAPHHAIAMALPTPHAPLAGDADGRGDHADEAARGQDS